MVTFTGLPKFAVVAAVEFNKMTGDKLQMYGDVKIFFGKPWQQISVIALYFKIVITLPSGKNATNILNLQSTIYNS